MGSVLMTVELEPDAATVADAAVKLGLDPADIDDEFGVVSVDPDNHLFSVLVSKEAGARARGAGGVEGPFSDPRIEPFGPPSE
jgi:hypothetical protein